MVVMYVFMFFGIFYSMIVYGLGIFFYLVVWVLGEKVQCLVFMVIIMYFCKSQCMLFFEVEVWLCLNVVCCGVGLVFEDVLVLLILEVLWLVFVGCLCVEKGVLLLIEVVIWYVKVGKFCELVLVGDGLLWFFIEKVMVGGLLVNVICIFGWKSSVEVCVEIECSWVLVLFSFVEGLLVVVMEVLVLLCLVISMCIVGIVELVEDGVNGWVVVFGLVDVLVMVIDEVILVLVEQL